MYFYVYKTTNLITGLIYIGKHESKHLFDSDYYGSGYKIKAAIKEHGIHNFVCEPLYYSFTKADALNQEITLIALYESRNPLIGYNVHKGGNGWCCTSHRPETIEKLRKNHYNNTQPEINQKRSVKLKGKKHSTERLEAIKQGHDKKKITKICKFCNFLALTSQYIPRSYF